MYNKTKHNEKKAFLYKLFTILSSKKLLANYKTIFLRINSKQDINTPKEYSIPEFTNYNKQL